MKNTLYILLFFCLIVSVNCKEAPAEKPQEVEFLLEHKIRAAKASDDKPPMLILLHGLRSNEEDLFVFGQVLDEELLVVSARAPFEAGNNRYKWYDYQSNGTGTPTINLNEAEESRTMLIEFIDQLVSAYDVDEKRVFVAGFSQGAMMAYSIGLTQPDKVKGIGAFSGNIPDWVKGKLANKRLLSKVSAFVSHGKKDNVLSYDDALADKEFLEEIGIKVSFHDYDTPHTMNRANIMDFRDWLHGEI